MNPNHPSQGTEIVVGAETTALPRLTLESIKNITHLEIKVEGNFGPVIKQLSETLSIELKSRPEGFHITVVGPTESGKLKDLSQDQLDRLLVINKQLQAGQGIHPDGIGYIDGADPSRGDIRVVDKTKKTIFLTFSSEAVNEFRESIGLPRKDLHITLGFVESEKGGDIHTHIIGKDEKGKDILAPIPKKAGFSYEDLFLQQLPDMHIKYGEVGGPDKLRKKG